TSGVPASTADSTAKEAARSSKGTAKVTSRTGPPTPAVDRGGASSLGRRRTAIRSVRLELPRRQAARPPADLAPPQRHVPDVPPGEHDRQRQEERLVDERREER